MNTIQEQNASRSSRLVSGNLKFPISNSAPRPWEIPATSFSNPGNTTNVKPDKSVSFVKQGTSPDKTIDFVKTSNSLEESSIFSKITDFVSDISMPSLNMASIALGQGLSALNSGFNSSTNSNLMYHAKAGDSQFGHSAFSEVQTSNIVSHNNFYTDLENSALSVGSLFGPEGLAVGALAAGGLSIVSHFTQPDNNIIPTNMGTMTDNTDL